MCRSRPASFAECAVATTPFFDKQAIAERSLFKRGIIGNYHKLSVEHLDRYLGEFCWRYNRRHQQPQLFDMALKNLAARKPLPYKDLTFETIFDLGRVK